MIRHYIIVVSSKSLNNSIDAGINAIVQTFRRYNYNVVSNHQEDRFIEDLKKRSQYLEKYLKM